jgi:hypothetical protein
MCRSLYGEDNASAAVTLTAGTDYILDANSG